MIKRETIRCPYCGKIHTIEYDNVIDITNNNEMMNNLLYGNYFTFQCPECHELIFEIQPFVCIDYNKKFMVCYDDIYRIFQTCYLKEYIFENYGINIDPSEYHIVGSNMYLTALEKVVVLDCGLNHIIMTLYKTVFTVEYNKTVEEDEKLNVNDSYFFYDLNRNLQLRYNDFDGYHFFKFNSKLYDNLNKNNIDNYCDYYFDTNILHEQYNEEDPDYPYTLSIVIREDDTLSFALIPYCNRDKFSINDYVLISEKGSFTSRAKILMICHGLDRKDVPMSVKDPILVLNKLDSYQNKKLVISNRMTDNSDLFINNEVQHSRMQDSWFILGIEVDKVSKEKERTRVLNNPNFDYQMIEDDNYRLLVLYSFFNDVPDKYCKDDKYVIANFDDIVKFVLSNPSKIDGVCILNNRNINLTTSYLMLEYLPNRVMTDNEKFKEYLKNMNDDEKDHLGKDSYMLIYDVYFNNLGPKRLAEKYHFDMKYVDECLGYGYGKIKRMLICNS